ncbi:hypothetical protein [Spirosoma sp. KNUC1025]|uniref:hypothetical protein n=1 Tax=Spirosoma sp. KNUC1025 TaxID=2894082 RepID=UPI00386C6969|nr:hypothetical protein LN737_07710 [Spirosoma sp. KNUC1025]
MMKYVEKIKNIFSTVRQIKTQNHDLRFQIGTLLAKNSRKAQSLREAEFKVFSQFGDDGIIQFLLNRLAISADKFVEFGVENYEESNTRFLLMFNNWRGLVIDGSESNITYIKNDPLYWRHDLTAVNSFITVENINQILADNGFSGRIGVLSIDIDGNDYWVWQAITVAEADIVIIEYNSLFGPDRSITVPYKADFNRIMAHYSGLYFGASLQALCDLGVKKGYAFVGCNNAGNNAYFVKKSLLNGLATHSAQEGYINARFREARNIHGDLTFANKKDRLKEIAGMPVIDCNTGIIEPF